MAGLRRYANRRDASEPAIVQALEAMGCSVVRMDKPVDLLIGFRGETMLAECKTPGTARGKKLTEDQKAFIATWRGSSVVILKTSDDAVSLVKAMARAA